MLFSNRAIFSRNGIPRYWIKKFKTRSVMTGDSYLYADWDSYKIGKPLATDSSYYATNFISDSTSTSTYATRVSTDAKAYVSVSFYASSDLISNNSNGQLQFYLHSLNGNYLVDAHLSFGNQYAPPRVGDANGTSYEGAVSIWVSNGDGTGTERRFQLGINHSEIANKWCTVNFAYDTGYGNFSNWAGGTSGSIFGRIVLETQSGGVYRCDQTDTDNYNSGSSFTTQPFNTVDASNTQRLSILSTSNVTNGDYGLMTNLWVLEGATFDPLTYYTKFSSGGLPREPGSTVASQTPDLRIKFNDQDNDSYTGGQIILTPDVGLGSFGATSFVASGYQQSTMDSLYGGNPWDSNIPA